MHIEGDTELRKRKCVECGVPYGKWTCDCGHATCSRHVRNHARVECSGTVEVED